jgi:putative oxidoreductase
MSEVNEPRLLLPFLGGFYRAVSDLHWPIIRLTVGATVFIHGGWSKINGAWRGLAAGMPKMGIEPAVPMALLITGLETVGVVCVILGLFTRFFAAALAIQMAYITFVIMGPRGFAAYELTLIWGAIFFAIALRGGGPYSLDRRIGREL